MPDYSDRAYERVDCGAGTPRAALADWRPDGDTLHPHVSRPPRLERIVAPRGVSVWLVGFIWGVLLGGIVAAYLVRGPLP